jgi:hypothetical protein
MGCGAVSMIYGASSTYCSLEVLLPIDLASPSREDEIK